MTALGTYLDDGRSYVWGLPEETPALLIPLPDEGAFLVLSRPVEGEPLLMELRDSHGAVLRSSWLLGDGWQGSLMAGARLANGNMVVVFSDGDDVGLTLVAPDLTALPSQTVNTWRPLMQDRAVVTALDDGGFVVAWHSLGQDAPLGGFGLYAQRFDGMGRPVGSEFRINDVVEGDQFDVQLAVLPGGRFLAVWTTEETGGYATDVMAQMFGADNARLGPAIRLNSHVNGFQDTPLATALPDGKVLVTWRSPLQDGAGDGIYARLIHPDGTFAGGEFRVNDHTPGSQNQAVASALPGGGFVVAWTSSRNSDDYPGRNILYRVFDADGNALDGDRMANQVVLGEQTQPLVQVLADGGFVIAWNVELAAGWAHRDETAFHARRFHADGTPVGSEAVLISGNAEPGDGSDRALWLLSDGALLALWGQGADHSIFRPLDPFTGDARDNLVRGTGAAELLRGGLGDDTLAAAGNDTLEGGPGQDTVLFDGAAPVRLRLGVEAPQDSGQGTVVLRSIENATGGSGDDILAGDEGANVLRGRGGNDLLAGMAGNDTLYGGDGADTLNGGDGDDFLFGGDSEADLRDVIYGGDGNDWIDGGWGNDELHGGNGNDTVAGGFGADTLYGNDGADVLSGGAGADEIHGGAGDDWINGGFGHDRLNGGAGADTFFHQGLFGHGSDWIQDYRATEGDVLAVGIAGATPDQFGVNFAHTPGAGDADVAEAFVIWRPTGQILFALVDGAGQASLNLMLGGEVHDLLA